LTGLRPGPAGAVTIEVTFDISSDGIVSVAAKDLDTGKEQSITVTAASGLTEEEIQAMIKENESYLVQLKEGEDLEKLRAWVRKQVREVERLASLLDGSSGPQRMAGESAETVVSQARAALDEDTPSALKNSIDQLESALSDLKTFVD
jgi:molecular chaperone DnaK